MTGSLKVVLTSPRVAPGLLTHPAWAAFTEADAVLAASSTPNVMALEAAGYVVELVDGDAYDHWVRMSSAASSGARVAWLVGDDGEPGLIRLIADALHRGAEAGVPPEYGIEIVHGSYDVPGARLIDLVRVMDRLRSNCPWDQEQTHESLAKYLLEETYETLEAIDTGDRDHLREELGDLLLQVAFHSRIAAEDEAEGFTIDDVAAGIVEKLIRRHPHVFASAEAADAAAVEANWETIKAAEKQRTSVLEGIPLALPALALADKVLGRSAKIHPYEPPTTPTLGDKLLLLVQEARAEGIDPEQALRQATHALADQIRTTESGQ